MAKRAPVEDAGDAGLAIGKPKTWGAGVPGVMRALTMSADQMGVARSLLTLTALNQKHGFDCPGCAWPDRRSSARGGVLRERRQGGRRGGDPAPGHPRVLRRAPGRRACRPQSDYWLGQQGRLTQPMLLRRGRRPTTSRSPGTHAFDLIADELRGLDHPDEAVFYTSGRTSNEAAFLYQLFAREFGTNNLPDCSNMCHESSRLRARPRPSASARAA